MCNFRSSVLLTVTDDTGRSNTEDSDNVNQSSAVVSARSLSRRRRHTPTSSPTRQGAPALQTIPEETAEEGNVDGSPDDNDPSANNSNTNNSAAFAGFYANSNVNNSSNSTVQPVPLSFDTRYVIPPPPPAPRTAADCTARTAAWNEFLRQRVTVVDDGFVAVDLFTP